MAEGKLAKCSRFLLIILNLVFWLIGVVLLGCGLWVVASDSAEKKVTEWLHMSIDQDTLNAVGYTAVGIGAFMFLIGFAGCCGAIRENAILLGGYIIFMVILLCGELAAIVYVAVERSSIEAQLKVKLLTDVRNYTSLSNKTTALDLLQAKGRCCGVDNFTDYRDNVFFKTDKQNSSVPNSCCQSYMRGTSSIPVDRDMCQLEARLGLLNGSQLFTKGCLNSIRELIDDNSAIWIGVASGILVLELIGVVLAIYLCRNRTDYDFDYDEDQL
ncbi:CD82 antigen-like [Dreissena polymorpha]|uniref:Tetraspanin n=1 Tax=Dreissena polymorpha TaxID=45954 RepID=A0A9D4S161_DREPO|nr:CD82 antigen-like [Dreissena polymorpha]XP_052226225.1 CD82 antigen-like [Dreissena polymorpha]KAH3886052.1 hypothetical protein DPMN_010053 [Dreissena polymorpha]